MTPETLLLAAVVGMVSGAVTAYLVGRWLR